MMPRPSSKNEADSRADDCLRELVNPDTGESYRDCEHAVAVWRKRGAAPSTGQILKAIALGGRYLNVYWDFKFPRSVDDAVAAGGRQLRSSGLVVLSRMNAAHRRGENYEGGIR
jgi:hypothetical protein